MLILATRRIDHSERLDLLPSSDRTGRGCTCGSLATFFELLVVGRAPRTSGVPHANLCLVRKPHRSDHRPGRRGSGQVRAWLHYLSTRLNSSRPVWAGSILQVGAASHSDSSYFPTPSLAPILGSMSAPYRIRRRAVTRVGRSPGEDVKQHLDHLMRVIPGDVLALSPFELLVSPPGRLFVADRGARAPGRRSKSGVGREVAGGREGAAVTDLDQAPGSGPDADSRHGRQDLRKRVSLQQFLSVLASPG